MTTTSKTEYVIMAGCFDEDGDEYYRVLTPDGDCVEEAYDSSEAMRLCDEWNEELLRDRLTEAIDAADLAGLRRMAEALGV